MKLHINIKIQIFWVTDRVLYYPFCHPFEILFHDFSVFFFFFWSNTILVSQPPAITLQVGAQGVQLVRSPLDLHTTVSAAQWCEEAHKAATVGPPLLSLVCYQPQAATYLFMGSTAPQPLFSPMSFKTILLFIILRGNNLPCFLGLTCISIWKIIKIVCEIFINCFQFIFL